MSLEEEEEIKDQEMKDKSAAMQTKHKKRYKTITKLQQRIHDLVEQSA